MQQIKAHYDRYLLILAGLVLSGVALLMALNAGELSSRFAPAPVRNDGAPFEADPAVALLASDRNQMQTQQAWQASDGSLFVSRVYLLRDGALVDILESGSELFAGIPNSWILEHNLDYTSASLPENDPDADGFTNREEFEGKTNPKDAASKPALWTKLRLTNSKIDKLRVKFMSLPTGSLKEVSINTISEENPEELSGSTQFYPRASEKVRTAEGEGGIEEVDKNIVLLAGRSPSGVQVFKPTNLVFERAEMRKQFNQTTNVEEEVQVAFLRNNADGMEIKLERGEVRDSPYSLATLLDTRSGGQAYELRSGETFKIGDTDAYKLVDVKEEKAIIENLQTGERHDVPFQSAAPTPEVQSELFTQ